MNAPLLRHVSAPPKMLYTAPRLLMIEALLGIILGAALLNPLAAIALWLVTHPLAIVCAIREPHTDAYIQAWSSYRPLHNHLKTSERVYLA